MAELKHPETSLRILLGGGIGSGKSIAGQRFEELGAVVVEADQLGHEMLEPDGESFRIVSERWPSVVVDSGVDRSALAEIVFADREQLTELESLTHPLIIERISELASGPRGIVVEVPLILGIPGDWTRVFVDADEDIRVRRAVDRGGSETDVMRRMTSQPPRGEWLAWADHTITNSDSIESLQRQIDALWYELRTADHGLQA